MTRGSSTTRLRHTVRLVHASTGAPLRAAAARLEPAFAGWSVRQAGGAVVVSVRAGAREPEAPARLVLALPAGPASAALDVPAAAGRPPRTLMVELDRTDVEVPVHPVPMALELALAAPSTGDPRTGAAVEARALSGTEPRAAVPLPEDAPGVYRSAAVEWTADFTPLELLVDGAPLRVLSMDFTAPTTRLRLVDTT